jgi:GntR family transcriptional regulator
MLAYLTMAREARYLHICEALQHQINTLAPNTLLPSEHELAGRFGVSRVTIRRALGLLERSGVVSRQRGRGTTVNPPKITRWLSPMHPFEEDLRRQGIKFETQILEYLPRHAPPPTVRQSLNLPEGAAVGFLSLLRRVDDRVICLDRRHFPPDIAARFDPQMILERPVADVLAELSGSPISAADWTTEIVAAPREVAAQLGITPGVLILINTGTEYLPDGMPIQVHTMSYRIDRVRFQFAANYAASPPHRSATTISRPVEPGRYARPS